MWLAVSACGGAPPAWMTTTKAPKVSIFDAAPLAGATYVATVDNGDFGHPGPRIVIEHGSFQCRQLVELLHRDRGDGDLAGATQRCDLEVAKLLRGQRGFVFVVDGTGRRWLSTQEVLAAAGPIDSPAKALLAVWVTGQYELGWGDGKHYYGSIEDGLVRQVAGGYEVVAGTSTTDSNCGGRNPRQTVTNYRLTLFVDTTGTTTVRAKVVSHRYDIADPCHPMGRRPAGFADVASGGTLRGHLLRAMHHEAESVRAFERIARELRAHGAPGELCLAAAQAARDERDHAERYARLAGVPVAIADDALPVRGLLDLAIDNAREGCIGEAYAALANVVQARTATHPELRALYLAIAVDELAHAALAHAIAGWLEGALSAGERAQVRAARDAAAHELATSIDMPATDATRALGLPAGAAAARLLEAVVAAGSSGDDAPRLACR